ncbi:MAG: ATP-binding protein [Clostridiales bacterium]|jgi:DNA replication protein DnaC|nr:ATP-binding protein [Clostridiales bacterium]
MLYKTAYKEVMRQYDADRSRAAALLDARRKQVFEKLPRAREIENELAAVGISLTRAVLGGSPDSAGKLRLASAALKDERVALFKKNKIPADFFTDIYKCKNCSDTGYIETPSGVPERCACLKQRLIEAYYGISHIKNVLAEENFDTFDLRYYSTEIIEDEGLSPHVNMQAVLRTAMQFVQRFDGEFQNLLLYGDTGLGKTFLCNCIAKDLLDRGKTVLYVTAPRLFRVVEDYRFNRDRTEEPDEMIDAATEAELLILDDLGAEFSTVVTVSALFDIINQRLLSKKPTVISTNLSQKGLSQYSERTTSRFLGYYKMLKFFGDDIREMKKYKV